MLLRYAGRFWQARVSTRAEHAPTPELSIRARRHSPVGGRRAHASGFAAAGQPDWTRHHGRRRLRRPVGQLLQRAAFHSGLDERAAALYVSGGGHAARDRLVSRAAGMDETGSGGGGVPGNVARGRGPAPGRGAERPGARAWSSRFLLRLLPLA